jgi:hypothetical protein
MTWGLRFTAADHDSKRLVSRRGLHIIDAEKIGSDSIYAPSASLVSSC